MTYWSRLSFVTSSRSPRRAPLAAIVTARRSADEAERRSPDRTAFHLRTTREIMARRRRRSREGVAGARDVGNGAAGPLDAPAEPGRARSPDGAERPIRPARSRRTCSRSRRGGGPPFTGATFSETSVPAGRHVGAVGPSQFVVSGNGRPKTFNKTTGLADGVINADPDVFFASAMTPVGGNGDAELVGSAGALLRPPVGPLVPAAHRRSARTRPAPRSAARTA